MAEPKRKMSPEEARAARQTMVNNILKADQSKPLAVLLLYGTETTTEAESKAKLLLNRLDPIKCSGIEGAAEAAKSENLHPLQ